MSNTDSHDTGRPYLGTVSFWLGSLLLGSGVGAYNAFWGSPEPYLRGVFGLVCHMIVVSIIMGIPAPGFLLAVRLSPKMAKERFRRLYVLSACCGILYGGCLLPCFLIVFLGAEFSRLPAGLLWGIWLFFPFVVGRIVLWVASRGGNGRPKEDPLNGHEL